MLHVVVASLQVVVEICRHLEEAAELDVVVAQQVIQPALADEDDSRIQRDRLGLQRRRAHPAVGLGGRLDLHLPGEQGLLECLPDERPGQHAAGVEDQISAIRLQQRAAAHQPEIGYQRAHLRTVLHTADNVRVARIGLVDHGRPVGICIIDDEVHFVLAVELLGIPPEERQ